MPLLEAVPRVAHAFGIPQAELKPCVAALLSGHLDAADRHDAAFLIAIELRRIGWNQTQVRRALRKWAGEIGYAAGGGQAVRGALKSAFAKTPKGRFRYHPPGLEKKPGTKAALVLQPFCKVVGCPARCAPLAYLARAPLTGYGIKEFYALGWRGWLRKHGHDAAIDWYRALTVLERQRKVPPGARLFTSYEQLSQFAERHRSHCGENLDYLLEVGLLTEFERGSGSGPHARDKTASQVRRTIPIPAPPESRAITSDRPTRPSNIGRKEHPLYRSPRADDEATANEQAILAEIDEMIVTEAARWVNPDERR